MLHTDIFKNNYAMKSGIFHYIYLLMKEIHHEIPKFLDAYEICYFF